MDAGDLEIWQSHYGMDDSANADGDGDSDGADFLAWQRNYTGSVLPPVYAVPEPATSATVICYTMFSLILSKRTRRER